MAEALLEPVQVIEETPDMSHIITEDDEPVDNVFSEKQQRLLVEPLYSSWNPGKPFIAAANVGIFNAIYEPPIVPDMFLSLNVHTDKDLWPKQNRSYFIWKFGKAPEVAVEVVSNTQGGEADKKFRKYARIGVWYYVIFDPQRFIQEEVLRVYELSFGQYTLKQNSQLDHVGLGLKLWNGPFEDQEEQWLRWYDLGGRMILTGAEVAIQERQRADREQQRAEQAQQRAEQAQQRAERLAAQLRALGIEPDDKPEVS